MASDLARRVASSLKNGRRLPGEASDLGMPSPHPATYPPALFEVSIRPNSRLDKGHFLEAAGGSKLIVPHAFANPGTGGSIDFKVNACPVHKYVAA